MLSHRVFTIAPGAPFLKTFVAALLDGRIVEGFSRAQSPLSLADATIYVPTRRAGRSLMKEFAEALAVDGEHPATLLPRILPLGALDATETALFFEEPGLETPLADDLPQAASEIWRRMQLARLVFRWARALTHAIVSVDADGTRKTDDKEACLVGTSPLDAFALAGSLADLIDELIIEDVSFTALDRLALPELDSYWRITLDFLNVAIEHWPKILDDHKLIDAARRRVLLVERQIAAIATGQKGPVIAIGSTGTNRATAHLLAAIAHAPQGAVVLPGLDRNMDEASWRLIGNMSDDVGEPAFGHPQAALARLLRILKVPRAEIVELGRLEGAQAARMAFVAEALRPAETTENWRDFRKQILDIELSNALAGVSFIDAADEREEALALAIALREILEEPGKTAALVTPDRNLARRVAAELTRFGLDIEDSAGEPLTATPYGILARLVVVCVANDFAGEDITALLAHPLARFGLGKDEIARLAPLFEIGLLRQDRSFAAFATAQEAIATAKQRASDRFAHPAQKRIGERDWTRLEDLARRLIEALKPLRDLDHVHPLAQWVVAHRNALDQVTQSDENPAYGEDYAALQNLFDEIAAASQDELTFTAEAYLLFFAQTAGTIALRRQKRAHPRLKIFGLLEARLMDADLMLLGGLDETVWPPETRSDAFLNRPMRTALGLSPPERKIGQTAHDFVAAMGAPRVILSRAQKRDGAPTVASRFLQRLAALGGAAFEACRTRGETYLAYARGLDRPPAPVAAIARPMPRPPVHLRPERLSVTRVETLRRDPYAIYAEFILRLIELPPLAAPITYRMMGTAIHEVLAQFCDNHPADLPADAHARLIFMLRQAFAGEFADPEFAAFVWPRIANAAAFYLDFEAGRRSDLAKIDVEIEGRLPIALLDGSVFTLSAKADRLEHRRDGTVGLIDYKTGTPPGLAEVRVGFAPQLTLEAAMATRGAFDLAIGTPVTEALYVKLGGKGGGELRPLAFNGRAKSKEVPSLAEVAEEHFQALVGLLNQFRDATTAYPPRPFPKFAAKYNAYDHLARVKEWSIGLDESLA